MKRYLSWIVKRAAGGIVTWVFLILTVLSIVYAINFPSTPPTGEISGGKFMQYFNSIRVACPPGQYLNGYDMNFNKLCATAPAGANGAQWPQGPTGADGAQWPQGPQGPAGQCTHSMALYVWIVQYCNAGVITTNPTHLNCDTQFIGYLCQ